MTEFTVEIDALETFADRSLDLGEGLADLATAAGQITIRDDAFGVIGDAFGLVEKFHELRDSAMDSIRASSDAAYSSAESAIGTESEYMAADLGNALDIINAMGD